jgi:hypothetical protein
VELADLLSPRQIAQKHTPPKERLGGIFVPNEAASR